MEVGSGAEWKSAMDDPYQPPYKCVHLRGVPLYNVGVLATINLAFIYQHVSMVDWNGTRWNQPSRTLAHECT